MDTYPIYTEVKGVAGWSLPHWRVELFDGPDGLGFMSHPIAIAYVTEYPEGGLIDIGPVLDYMIVFDQWRDADVARLLMRACRDRWPRISRTSRLNPDGTWRD